MFKKLFRNRKTQESDNRKLRSIRRYCSICGEETAWLSFYDLELQRSYWMCFHCKTQGRESEKLPDE